jgi:hypothetical protein
MSWFSSSGGVGCLRVVGVLFSGCAVLASLPCSAQALGKEHPVEHPTFYRTISIDGLSIFYREAGPKMRRHFYCFMACLLPRGCSSFFSPGYPIAIT